MSHGARPRARRLAGIGVLVALVAAIGAAALPGPGAAGAGVPRTRAGEVTDFPPLIVGEHRLPAKRIDFEAGETDRCLECHGLPNFVLRDTLTRALRYLTVPGAAFRASVHARIACTDCHGDVKKYPHELAGERAKVGCDATCHASDSLGRVITHSLQAAEFRVGVHRGGMSGEDPASPSCAYCHGAGDPHAVGRARRSGEARERVLLCAVCHDDRARMVRAEVDPDAVASYERSFHYKAVRFGATATAVCQDCHGVHRVLAPDDTASTVSPGHLARTCGQEDCHEGARMNFASSGANHLDLRVRREPLLAAVRGSFSVAGFGLLAVLALGMMLDARRRRVGGGTRR